MKETSRIEVDLAAVAWNVSVIREALGGRGPAGAGAVGPRPAICAVIKSDAYGMGGARVARRLAMEGVDLLAVYTAEQARELVSAVTTPILLLMPIGEMDRNDQLYRAASHGRIHLAVHGLDHLRRVMEIADALGIVLPLHVEVDTGMSRGGVSHEEGLEVVERIARHPRTRLAGVYTHYACADTDAAAIDEQSARFDAWLAAAGPSIPPGCWVHAANTFALFRSRGHHRSMVRVGLALLGYGSEELAGGPADLAEAAERLQPAVRWVSRVVHVKPIDPGTAVGYGSTWRASRPTRVGLVPVGYADGYPLALSSRSSVGVRLLDGSVRYAPVIGRVSMDQLTIDLTDLPAAEAREGMEVEVIGADRTAPTHLPTLAQQAGTISHELLCRLSHRVKRAYIALPEARATPAMAG